jgi:hypothetical protein
VQYLYEVRFVGKGPDMMTLHGSRFLLTALAPLLLCGSLACGRAAALNASPTTFRVSTGASPRQLDMVFMIDDAIGFAPKATKVLSQLPKLIDALKDPTSGTLPDLRIALIDSDLGDGQVMGSHCDSTGNGPFGDMGKFQMPRASSCGVTDSSAMWLEYNSGKPVNYKGEISSVFACLASGLSTTGCGYQHQLQAFEWALVAGGIGNDAQEKMLRPTADLALFFMTDEDDCSAATNDGIFTDSPALLGEAGGLRCATRSIACGGKNLTQSPPGFPTVAPFSAPLATCTARTDACPNATDGNGAMDTDTSKPTSCSPLKDVHRLAEELKSLKADPNQFFVAGVFGLPLSDADAQTAQYKIDLVPNPNIADTDHPQVFDLWPICYDPNHLPPADGSYSPAAWGCASPPSSTSLAPTG